MQAALACLRDNHEVIARHNQAFLGGATTRMAMLASHTRKVEDGVFVVVLTMVARSIEEASDMTRAASAPLMRTDASASLKEVRFDGDGGA